MPQFTEAPRGLPGPVTSKFGSDNPSRELTLPKTLMSGALCKVLRRGLVPEGHASEAIRSHEAKLKADIRSRHFNPLRPPGGYPSGAAIGTTNQGFDLEHDRVKGCEEGSADLAARDEVAPSVKPRRPWGERDEGKGCGRV